jgi:hypothetical protein
MHAAVGELETGSGDEIHHGPGHEHFARLCQRRDAGRESCDEPLARTFETIAFAGVESDPERQALARAARRKGLPAPDGACRSIERGEDAVAGALGVSPAEADPQTEAWARRRWASAMIGTTSGTALLTEAI